MNSTNKALSHTQIPWAIKPGHVSVVFSGRPGEWQPFISIENSDFIAGGGVMLVHDKPNGVGMTNATFVVRACNSHQALVDALRANLVTLQYLFKRDGYAFLVEEIAKTEAALQAGQP